MKKLILYVSLLTTIFVFNTSATQPIDLQKKYFKKVILWGHKLHSHTHSYIHWGYSRAFKHLGYDTYWFDNNDDVSNFDFSGSLFITEGQVDQKMPVRTDCRYVLHNCDNPRYADLQKQGLVLRLQVFHNEITARAVEQLAPYTYFEPSNLCLYQPWATDLLPHEIEAVKKEVPRFKKDRAVYLVASVGGGNQFENASNYRALFRACSEQGISWQNFRSVSMEKNMELMQRSIIAPAIQSKWQCEQGYIPCRIFKNISYGQLGITNSKTVYELFNKKIVYNSDTYQLVRDALKKAETISAHEIFEMMDFVRDHHTYLNRIEMLLICLDRIKPLEH